MLAAVTASSPTCRKYGLQPAAVRPLAADIRVVVPAHSAHRCHRCNLCTVRATALTATIAVSASVVDQPSAVDQPSESGLSMHPDAVRRRQERAARHQARELELEAAKTSLWWEAKGPENLILASTNEMLTDLVQQGNRAGQLVAVKFFAPWCQACKALYPKWIQLASQNPDVTFVKVNAADDTMRAVAAGMGVTKLPYFHMYMHGQLAKNFTANLHKISYLKRAISDCKQCLSPGCHT